MSGRRGTDAEVEAKWRDRLARWRRRLAVQDLSTERRRVGPAFLPIEVIASHDHSAGGSKPLGDGWMRITIGAVELRVPVSIDEVMLRRLMRVVREETGAC